MTTRHLVGIISCSGLWLVGSACTVPEPHSDIVERVERAGAGSLSSSSVSQIEDWLRKHRELAAQVDELCKPARAKADANWTASTEGRVCAAATNASMFYRQYHNPPPPKDDAVGPGLH